MLVSVRECARACLKVYVFVSEHQRLLCRFLQTHTCNKFLQTRMCTNSQVELMDYSLQVELVYYSLQVELVDYSLQAELMHYSLQAELMDYSLYVGELMDNSLQVIELIDNWFKVRAEGPLALGRRTSLPWTLRCSMQENLWSIPNKRHSAKYFNTPMIVLMNTRSRKLGTNTVSSQTRALHLVPPNHILNEAR